LLPGPEDRAIWDYFTSVGLPPEHLVTRVLGELSEVPISVPTLERLVDLRRTRLEALLKILDVDGAVQRGRGWIELHFRGRTTVSGSSGSRRPAGMRPRRCCGRAVAVVSDAVVALVARRRRRRRVRPVCRVHRPRDPVTLDPAVVRRRRVPRGVDVVIEPRRNGLTQGRRSPEGQHRRRWSCRGRACTVSGGRCRLVAGRSAREQARPTTS
jgi:hypothetical protein